MLSDSKAFNGFAVDDLEAAKEFYGGTLGLDVELVDPPGLLNLRHPDGHETMIYLKADFVPATYTILNFPVEDVEEAVDGLTAGGVSFERYEGFEQDEKGIARGEGPTIAWFKDPAGNILSVLTEG
jgi:catechol 2,3-dioxygenase-like lactoylglutathione lyase family enzyme